MRDSIIRTVVSVGSAATLMSTPLSPRTVDPNAPTVHEWGTFTSIAGPDGSAVEWRALGGPTDLPCFVERATLNIKGTLAGTVRMETPVLYFYVPLETTVDVRVRFDPGVITESFPHADTEQSISPSSGGTRSLIAWKKVRVLPGGAEDFPVEPEPSHYYAARHTNAAPIQSGAWREKFLFYRGVGRFQPPIAATIDSDGQLMIRALESDRIDEIIVFSNDHGRIRYELLRPFGGETNAEPAVVGQEPEFELEAMLRSHQLYPDEASAMVDTWRDSWFEEGSRLFYVVPRGVIDRVLPLEVRPPPKEIVRVFVARMELVTPGIEREVRSALVANDAATLAKYGRFVEAIGRRVVADAAPSEKRRLEQRLERAYLSVSGPDRCVAGPATR